MVRGEIKRNVGEGMRRAKWKERTIKDIYMINKKMFWKNVNEVRKGDSRMPVKVKN